MNALFNLLPLMIIIGPVLIVGAFVLLIVRQRGKARQRVESWQEVARELNFKFWGEVPYANLTGTADFELFTSGNRDSQRVYSLLTGTIHKFQASIFDFAYYTGKDEHLRDENSSLHFQTVVMLDFSAQIRLSQFRLKPESGRAMKAVNNSLGNRSGEIKFPAHPVFNEKCLLRSPDEQRTRMLFNDRAVSFCESVAGLSIEGAGNRLIFYRDRVKIEPQQIRPTLDEALTAANLMLSQNAA